MKMLCAVQTASYGLLALFYFLLAPSTHAGPAPTPAPITNGKIAFESNRDSNHYEIYSMDADGSNLARLTANSVNDFEPAWSPDGRKIAFITDRDGNYEIYVMDANGFNQIRLTNNPAVDFGPTWSPDGTKIAFASARDGFGNFEIYVMGANGSNPTRLTNNPAEDFGPTWSPDGTKIAFTSERDGNYEVYVMNANGSSQTRLTNNPAWDTGAAWSPDGTKIAFASARDGNFEIYVMDPNGASQTNLTNHPATDDTPNWSPDGTRITFTREEFSPPIAQSSPVIATGKYPVIGIGQLFQREIYVMESNGTNQINLTNNPAEDFDPAWQRLPGGPTPSPTPIGTPTPTPTPTPNGTPTPPPTPTPAGNGKIAFASNRSGHYEIYLTDAGGSKPIRLPGDVLDDYDPAWSSDGTKIAFTSNINGQTQIYLMDADGTNRIRLTNVSANDYLPTWSPDGTKIAFSSDRDGNTEIHVIEANGSNPINLTNSPAVDFYPGWSPDGTKIAFTTNRDGNYEIYVMDASGSNQTRLTNNSAADYGRAWSPDGTKIAFYSYRDDNAEIYVMDADGSNQTRLTNNSDEDFYPAWSPDGTKIVFTSRRFGNHNYEIYVMDANGANPINLTFNSSTDYVPDWQRIPVGQTPSPTPTHTPTPTPTPPATPTPTPAHTPTPTPPTARALNISTRMRVETGNNVLIGGFIVSGSSPKSVAVRGIGPSLAQFGVPDFLADPTIELRAANGTLLAQNDDWQDDPDSAAQLTALGLVLQHPDESGLVASLQPNAYTVILAGAANGTGVGLVEIYDTNAASGSELANISTRGFVLTGDNVMIGGFILGGSGNTHVAVRGIGPSLTDFGIGPVLADPTLELHDGNGAVLVSNDNWQDDPVSAAQLTALGIAPSNTAESGIYTSLPPGTFTAVLAGKNNGTGIGLVEIYSVH